MRCGSSGGTADPISFVCDDDEGPEGITKSLRLALSDAEQRPVLDEGEFALTDDMKGK